MGECVEHNSHRPLENDPECPVVRRIHAVRERRQCLTKTVPCGPALDAGDTVPPSHRFTIMEFQPGAQRECPDFAVI